MTDYKQLCAELVAAWDDLPWHYDWKGNLIGLADGCQLDDSAVERARAALAKPEPERPTDAETEPVIKPIQPPGRIGMTWQQTIQGLRDVLADESKDAVQMVWQRTRICDAVDLMEANSAALAEPEPEGPTDEELLQIFDTACLSEGGMVDEIHLRGLRAVLARWGNHPESPDSSMQPS